MMPLPNTTETSLKQSGASLTRHNPHILIIDDEPDIRNLLREILEDEGYQVSVAENGASAREHFHSFRADLVLLDIWMPDVDGITLLQEMTSANQLTMPVIMMSGHGTVETAVEATRLGAYDFIEKPLSLAKLLLTIEQALHDEKARRENIEPYRNLSLPEPIGKSELMQALRKQIKQLAQHDAPVLLLGEEGSELQDIVHYLHRNSPRQAQALVELDLGSITPEQFYREAFGYEEEGRIHTGLLEQATGGSLFIPALSVLDNEIQATLCHVFKQKQFYRLNGTATIPFNARVIAACPMNIEALLKEKKLSQELYYYLNVLPLRVPSLREHREDIPDLLNYYTTVFVDQETLPYRKFSMAAQNRLRNYYWPGNIRELINLVQRLLITGTGSEISLEEVEKALETQRPKQAGMVLPIDYDRPLREARELFERTYFEYQLRKLNGSVGKVAQVAGLERTHLYRKLRSLGIDPKAVTTD